MLIFLGILRGWQFPEVVGNHKQMMVGNKEVL